MNWRGNRQRWLGAGLVVSLALNAFFIGAAATDVLHLRGEGGRHQGGALRFELRWLGEHLPPDAMATVKAAVAAGRPDAQRHIDRLRELRTTLANQIAAAEPDRAAIEATLADIRAEFDGHAGRRAGGHDRSADRPARKHTGTPRR